MKQKFILIISVALGLLAAAASRAWLDAHERKFRQEYERLYKNAEKVAVVGTSRQLAQGTVIQEEDIGKMTVFAGDIRDDAIRLEEYQRIIGRKLKNPLSARSPILWTDIEGGRTRTRTLSDDVKEGMRAVSIPVSGAAAVSGMIRPNDCVDVLGSFALPNTSSDGYSETELVTFTVLQNVTVLATGSDTFRTISANNRQASNYGTVTLQVTPREAELLVFAQQMKGKLVLSLRNQSDTSFERDLPRIDFDKVEKELQELNEARQKMRRSHSI